MNTPLPTPIIVGVDGSPSADLALDWAADEARLRRTALKLVYVVDSPGPRGAYGYLTDEVTCFGDDLLSVLDAAAPEVSA